MNPWKILGWVILVFFFVALAFCGLVCVRVASDMPPSSSHPAPSAAPSASSRNVPVYHVDIQSFTCEEKYGRVEAAVTVRNSGGNEIPFAKAFFKVGTSSFDGYFSPSSIPPGALASVSRSTRDTGDCSLAGIQDGGGNSVTITPLPK